MKILLIGKNGLLGTEINTAFKEFGEFEFYSTSHDELDITNDEAVDRILSDFNPNLVINAAGFTYVDECEAKKNFVMQVNGYSNEFLAKKCKEIDASLMYFSTDYVFDGTKKEGYKEDDQTSPINTYGESKLLGEELIQKNTDKFYIIRTSWLFGMHGQNFVKTMLRLAEEGKQISVVNDQFGKPTYTIDLANGILDFVKTGHNHGIYHLVNENSTSWFEFAKKIFDFKNLHDVDLVSTNSGELKRPAKRPQISILQNTKLPHLRPHEEALKDYLNKLS